MKRLLVGLWLLILLSLSVEAQTGTPNYPTSLDTQASLFDVRDTASTKLTASAASTATTLTVQSTSAFPAASSLALDGREQVYYTSKSATQFLGVVRARNGTTALTLSAGVSVECRVLAIHHMVLSAAIRALETKIGTGSSSPGTNTILVGSAPGVTGWVSQLPVALIPPLSLTNLAPLTSSRVLGTNGSGVISVTSVTTADLDQIIGVTSPIQAQLNQRALASRLLTGGAGISNTLGDLSADRIIVWDPSTFQNNVTLWDANNSTRNLTANLSGATDPVLTFANNSLDLATGVLKQGGVPVVLESRNLIAGTGLSGGGTMAADRTLTVVADTTNQRLRVLNNGTTIATRPTVNFIPGSNVTLTIDDNPGSNRIDLTIAASAGGGGGLPDPGSNGVVSRIALNTSVARTLTGTTNQVLVTDGTGVSANPTFSLPQNIHTGATPQFAGLGLGVAPPAAGLSITGKTLTTDADQTVAALTGNFSVTKNDSNTRVFYGNLIKPTLNTGGSNLNTTLNVLAVDTTNTSTTGLTTNLLNLFFGGSSVTRVTSGGGVIAATFSGDGAALTGLDAANIAVGTVSNSRIDADLAALANNSTAGFWANTGAGTGAARTLTAPAAGLTITNPAGTAGNPTFALANDLSAVEALSSTGFAVRTGTDTWAQRTLTAGSTSITITNGNGVSGDPVINTAQAIETTSTPEFARLGVGGAADANHAVKITQGTITSDKHAIDIATTWNSSGTTFTLIKGNATSTASAAGSLLMDLQVGGVSKATIDKAGALVVTSCTGCGGGSPGGSSPQVQYNNSGAFGGATNFTIVNNNPRVVSSAAPGSPNNGEFWYDSTQKTEQLYVEGIKTTRVGALFVATAAKTTANTTTATTMFGTGIGSLTIPANYFVPGRVIRVKCGGIYSTSTTGVTIGFGVTLGATTVFNGTFVAGTTTDGAGNGEPWVGELIIVCRTTGASGTVTAQMWVTLTDNTGTLTMTDWGLSSQMGNITVDTTASKVLDIKQNWSAASSSNSWTTNWAIVETVN